MDDLLLRLEIHAGGRPLDPAIEVRGVVVADGIDRVPTATVSLVDGSMPHGFRLGDRRELAPGSEITVCAGFGGGLEVLFQGAVVGQRIEADGGEDGVLRLMCEHAAGSLRMGRDREARAGGSPTEVLSRLIATTGLASSLDAADGKQALPSPDGGESDWDYLVAVARANDLAVVVRERSVGVVARGVIPGDRMKLQYGEDVLALRLSLTSDPGTGTVHRQGTVTFPGNARVRPGSGVELLGLGQRFDGPILVSAVRHDIAEGVWVTEAALGPSGV